MQSNDKFKRMYRVVALALSVQGVACSLSTEELAEEGLATHEQAILVPNDPSIAAAGGGTPDGSGGMNGISINGISINGISINGVQLNGVQLNGVQLNGVQVVGGQLVGTRSDTGEALSGEDFEGATLQGVLSDGSTVPLMIEVVDTTSDPQLLNYTVRYWGGSSWRSLCGEAAGAPVQALALHGRWDLSSGTSTGGDYIDELGLFTFACHGAALAKCVTLGYKPWQTMTECTSMECREVPMRALHQACTRMIRADYCGDGTPHTRTGVPINVWDALNVQQRADTQGAWLKDAEWSSEGAVCIEHLRYQPGETTAYINAHCPERWLAESTCFGGGSTFYGENAQSTPLSERSLIRNEFDRLGTTP
jgi:hypothetical protein